MKFWFNVKTGQVEADDDPERARIAYLMGPYASEEEAAGAVERAAERTAQWEDEERQEDEWATGDPDRRQWDNNPLND